MSCSPTLRLWTRRSRTINSPRWQASYNFLPGGTTRRRPYNKSLGLTRLARVLPTLSTITLLTLTSVCDGGVHRFLVPSTPAAYEAGVDDELKNHRLLVCPHSIIISMMTVMAR